MQNTADVERLLPSTAGSNGFSHVRTVGVIGAGVAGLQMARACLAHGLKVTVFEKAPKVGGLWRENYHSYGVQVPKQFFEFPDFPFDAVQWGDYPTGAQTAAYIESYANKFKLMPCIKFKHSITSLEPRADGKKGYVFKYETDSGNKGQEEFDFVVMATGMYSQVKNMPDWTASKGSFAGEIIHSSQYLDQAVAKGKNVIVIGSAKSAIDIVISTSEVAKEAPTLLFRHAHWATPRLIAGLIPFQYVFLSRLGQGLVSWYKGPFPDGAPSMCSILHCLLFPIMWLAFRVVELIFAIQRGQWGEWAPTQDVVTDFYGYGHITDTTLLNKWRQGALRGKKGTVKSLVAGGVETVDGETIKADLIICATGFKKTYDYLPSEVRLSLAVESDGIYLYRHCVPSNVRAINLAFCGSEVATASKLSTSAECSPAAWRFQVLRT
jgi:dimethylaniline monooxygenase (N-oxide forming)